MIDIECIVFSNDLNIALNKLLEIKQEKINNGIEAVDSRIFPMRAYLSEVIFSDGEKWIIEQPLYDNSSRGHRWKKAWVDASTITISQLENIIKPTGIYKLEDEKYF